MASSVTSISFDCKVANCKALAGSSSLPPPPLKEGISTILIKLIITKVENITEAKIVGYESSAYA